MAGTVFDNFLRNLNYKQSVAMTLGPEALNVMAPSSTSNEPSVKLGELSEGGYSYTSSQFYAVSMMLMFLLYSGLTVCTSLLMKRKSYPFPDKFNASQRLRTVYWQNAWCGCCKYSTVRSDYYSDECAVRCELGKSPGLVTPILPADDCGFDDLIYRYFYVQQDWSKRKKCGYGTHCKHDLH